MAWYIVCIIGGMFIGYMIKDVMPADIKNVFKGKFKQKGRNNTMTIDKPEKVKKRRLTRKERRTKK